MATLLTVIVLFLAPLLAAMPEEPLWSLVFGAALLVASAILLTSIKYSKPTGYTAASVVAFAALVILSLLFHWGLIFHGKPTYLDIMLKGTLFWLACAASYLSSASDRTRPGIYARVIAVVAGSSCAAGYGLQDYLFHLRYGQGQWREYGTSLPDFFAGQVLMIVPIALALFIGSKSGKGKSFWLLYLLALVVSMAVVPTTGSRFALISLPIGIVVVFLAITYAVRNGMSFDKASKTRLSALAGIVILGGIVVAKPIMSRLQTSTMKTQAHSGDFRVWTWKGTLRLIESSPIIGTGPGMFTQSYPKLAIVGFTEHAHDSYLQTAGDIGVPALGVLAALFAFSLIAALRGLKSTNDPVQEELVEQHITQGTKGKRSKAIAPTPKSEVAELWDQVFLVDDRYLIAGAAGSVAATLIQNLVDSDWYIFASGITLFALLGLISALTPDEKPAALTNLSAIWKPTAAVLGAAALLAAYFGIAESQHSAQKWTTAAQMDPISGKYATDAALKDYLVVGDYQNAETSLLTASKLEPSSSTFYRLGSFYSSSNQLTAAEQAWKDALIYDPHSVSVLMALADCERSLGRPGESLRYYQRVVDLETTPYGTVRAIPEVSETKFADADAAVADSLLSDHQPQQALPYYLRAQADCEEYASNGGASNGMRAALNGGVVNKNLDTHMRALYIRVINNLAISYADDGSDDQAEAVKNHLNEELKHFPGT